MVKKTIEIDGKQVPFKASATVPRIYRYKFRKDIFYDMKLLQEDFENKAKTDDDISISSLEIFENVAYIMAYHADPKNVPETAEEWLEEFETFSIYQILPELFELWNLNVETKVESKKKLAQLTEK